MAEDFSITVDGINELLLKLSAENLSRVSEDFCQEVAETVPDPIISAMKANCPYKDGTLENSFEAEVNETVHGISVQVGPNDSIHPDSKLPNFTLAGIFEWGGRVGSWIRGADGKRANKRRHKKRSASSHETQDTVAATHFMAEGWQRESRNTLDRVLAAAKKNLIDGLEQ